MHICLMINSFYRKQYSYLNFENNLCELLIAIVDIKDIFIS